MAFVDYCQEIFWKIVKQAEWTHAWQTPVEISGIVFYAGAIAHFPHHLQIVGYTFVKPFGLDLTAFVAEHVDLFTQIQLALVYG